MIKYEEFHLDNVHLFHLSPRSDPRLLQATVSTFLKTAEVWVMRGQLWFPKIQKLYARIAFFCMAAAAWSLLPNLLLLLFAISSMMLTTATALDDKEIALAACTRNATFQANVFEFRPSDPLHDDADYNATPTARCKVKHMEGKGGIPMPPWRDRSFSFGAHEVPSGPNPVSN